MATLNFSALTDLILENYGPTVIQSFSQTGLKNGMIDPDSIIGRLQDAGRLIVGPGQNSDRYAKDWGVDTAATTASTIDGSDSFPTAQNPTFDDAKIEWKRVVAGVQIDNLTMQAFRNGRGLRNDALAGDIRRKMTDVLQKVEAGLASDGTGNSGKDVTGYGALLSTSNTYAGIDQSAAAYWRANIVDASSGSLSEVLLNSLCGTMYDRKAIDSSVEIWANRVQYEKAVALFKDSMRFAPGGTNESFGTLFVPQYGVVIRKVHSIPNDEMWFIKRNESELRFLDHVPASDMQRVQQLQDAESYEGFPFGFELVSKDGDYNYLAVKAYVNLAQATPFKCGALINLAT